MADSITTCEAALVQRLESLVSAQSAPLAIFRDINVETGAQPPTAGYIQCWPFETSDEVLHSGDGLGGAFVAPWHWAVTVCVPRNTGGGLGPHWADLIAAHYRMLQLGDLTIEHVAVRALPLGDKDPYYQVQVIIRGEKISLYAAATP